MGGGGGGGGRVRAGLPSEHEMLGAYMRMYSLINIMGFAHWVIYQVTK